MLLFLLLFLLKVGSEVTFLSFLIVCSELFVITLVFEPVVLTSVFKFIVTLGLTVSLEPDVLVSEKFTILGSWTVAFS